MNDSHELQATQVQQLCNDLVGLAKSASAAGLSTLCSLALHTLEQLSPISRSGFASERTMSVLREWLDLSEAYLREPCSPSVTRALAHNLGDRRWERPVCETHRQALLTGLRHEGALMHEYRTRAAAKGCTRLWQMEGSSLAVR